jgi:malonyl-CoA/methylmalonyl-CoA synthetase
MGADHGSAADAADLLAEGTLPRAWIQRWAEDPGHPTVHDQVWFSAADLDTRSRQAAGALQAAGLKRGDHVLISAGAGIDLIAMHVGALRTGLVVTPANTAYTAPELAHLAQDSEAKVAVLDDVSRAPGIPVIHTSATGDEAEDVSRNPEDPALICYTSGTTGKPKGAILAHANVLAGAEALRRAWRWTKDDRLVLALPLFHMHGLGVGVHGTLLTGASMVLVPRFDPDEVLDAAQDHHATLFFGVPTMYARLAASPRCGELRHLRLCVSGSAPLPAELHERLATTAGQTVLERYGLTETIMNTSNPYEGERRPGSVGLPLPGVEVQLDETTQEIRVRGPNVFLGYWRQNSPAKEPDGWFRTGDIGAFDPDGYLRIVGRAKELIITGGYNVYPREVEEALETHPGVVEAAVVGTPDPEWGEIVTAYVVATPAVTNEDLTAHVKSLLAPYKRPRRVVFVDALPRNAMGKIDRNKLAQRN